MQQQVWNRTGHGADPFISALRRQRPQTGQVTHLLLTAEVVPGHTGGLSSSSQCVLGRPGVSCPDPRCDISNSSCRLLTVLSARIKEKFCEASELPLFWLSSHFCSSHFRLKLICRIKICDPKLHFQIEKLQNVNVKTEPLLLCFSPNDVWKHFGPAQRASLCLARCSDGAEVCFYLQVLCLVTGADTWAVVRRL